MSGVSAEDAALLACRKVTADEDWLPPVNPEDAARLARAEGEEARRLAEEAEARRQAVEARLAAMEEERQATELRNAQRLEARQAQEAERERERNAVVAQKAELERQMGKEYASLLKEAAIFLSSVEAEGAVAVPSARVAYPSDEGADLPRSEGAQRWLNLTAASAQLRTLEVRMAGAGSDGLAAYERLKTALATAPEAQRRLAGTVIEDVTVGRAQAQMRMIFGLSLAIAGGLIGYSLNFSFLAFTLMAFCIYPGAFLAYKGYGRASRFQVPAGFSEMLAQAPEAIPPARKKAWTRRALYATPAIIGLFLVLGKVTGIIRGGVGLMDQMQADMKAQMELGQQMFASQMAAHEARTKARAPADDAPAAEAPSAPPPDKSGAAVLIEFMKIFGNHKSDCDALAQALRIFVAQHGASLREFNAKVGMQDTAAMTEMREVASQLAPLAAQMQEALQACAGNAEVTSLMQKAMSE